jgi:hypothetical protein
MVETTWFSGVAGNCFAPKEQEVSARGGAPTRDAIPGNSPLWATRPAGVPDVLIVDVKKRIGDNIDRICNALMAHPFAHVLVRLHPSGAVWFHPGFHPGLRASAPPGHFSLVENRFVQSPNLAGAYDRFQVN